MKGKLLLITALMASAFMFVGCGEDSDEAKEYELKKALDKGDYDLVIRTYGDCENNSTGLLTMATRTSCYSALTNDQIMDLGAAYFGKASFSLIDLGGDLAGVSGTSEEQSRAVTTIIFSKLDNINMQYGINAFKYLLNGNDSICTPSGYSALNDLQKQACVSANPLLLKDLVDNDSTATKSTSSVSLEQMIAFKDILQDAAPGISIDEIVGIISDDASTGATASNVNNAGGLDSLEATTCAVKAANDDNLTVCSGANVTIAVDTNNTFSGYKGDANLSQVALLKLVITGISPQSNATKYRLVQRVNSTVYTNITQVDGKICDNTATESTSCTAFNDSGCVPCPKIVGGTTQTLNDTVANILNNDSLLTSIALSSDSEGSLTDAQKVSKLKTKMCGLTPGADANVSNWISDSSCTASAFNSTPSAAITTAADVACDCDSGSIKIGQDGLLNFMNN